VGRAELEYSAGGAGTVAARVKRKPFFAKASTAKMVGWALFITGSLCLYDAYDGRGAKGPWPLSALFPF